MTGIPQYQTMRTAPHAARSFLEAHGYCTMHLTNRHYPVDFIAWKGREDILFVRAFSVRGMKPKKKYTAHLDRLRSFVSSILCPGRVELWIGGGLDWKRYHVMSGGFRALSGGLI